ncbi:MAG: YggS family pyridoxal phosphate-dependent enzyme [Methylococcaceae bacterium]|nr:YggS family pyridoxal phosphate-dependent enzyme [Methylococcaceae bacterium]
MPFKQRLTALQSRIRQAETAANRPVDSVQLVAVSKTKPAADIVQAYLAGQRHFGENYVQEALGKQAELGAFDITWHFIGPIQSNKTKAIAQHFAWVHSVDRLKVAERLNAQRPAHLPPLKVCLQVNISRESSKSGIMLENLSELVTAIQTLPRIQLCGVMAVPEPAQTFELQRLPFKALYAAVNQLQQPTLTTFSMGMSDDLEAAIAEGSTLIRVGSALFGQRQ